MAFTLKIKAKALLGNKKIDIGKLLKNCNMCYGSSNEFYILEEKKVNQNTVILYNPKRIGRGIFLDFSGNEKGNLTISYNIPTTEAEIDDFIHLVTEIDSQLKKAEYYCEEEEKVYTVQELKNNRERMVSFSLSGLNNFCRNKEYTNYIFTLAMWPLVLTVQQVDSFAHCTSLNSFEQLLHEKQDMDVYYASPRLLQNRNTGKIGAFYTLTEECESIFPIHADGFLNLSGYEIAEGKIQFYIFSENRVMDEICDYEKYVAYMLSHGAVMYDETHMLVPSVTKEQISDMISIIKE